MVERRSAVRVEPRQPPAAAGQRPVVVGIDTGGTFTDLVAVIDGELRTQKVPSTADNPARAVLHGLRELLPAAVPLILTYASTVATNALLTRAGARVLLLTTAGFEDVIEIGRQNRPVLYDLEPRRPTPLVPRRRRVGVAERTLYDGSMLVRLTPAAVRAALRTVRRERPEAVAVCLLHAYANPAHERRLGAALATAGVAFYTLSHELAAEYGEYERASTTVVNAYVGPVMQRHLRDLDGGLRARGSARARLRVMQSNGGAISAPLAARQAVRTVLSGPAAGVVGAWTVARALRLQRVIALDMGGTSTDVSLLDGAPRFRTEWEIGGLALQVPAIDIHTVGAGGGSLARIDAGGVLKVGPESAGADPGPACYGRSLVPTVTDANLALGRLVAAGLLGGRLQLNPDRARQALARLGSRLRLAESEVAAGIVRVVNASMERAVRRISVERGHDPRAYTLIAFGGAAGQHACELSAALGIRRVVVPRDPGLLSARGAATAPIQRDYVRTVRLADSTAAQLRALFRALERQARLDLSAEGMPLARCDLHRSVDARYVGQSHSITLPLRAGVAAMFHAAHRRLYGYADAQRATEVVNLRLLVTARGPQPRAASWRAAAARPLVQRTWWAGRWHRVPVHERSALARRRTLYGPAVVTEFSATTFVAPGWRATVHPSGHLLLTHAR
jgi:N-methylhydantoinase A